MEGAVLKDNANVDAVGAPEDTMQKANSNGDGGGDVAGPSGSQTRPAIKDLARIQKKRKTTDDKEVSKHKKKQHKDAEKVVEDDNADSRAPCTSQGESRPPSSSEADDSEESEQSSDSEKSDSESDSDSSVDIETVRKPVKVAKKLSYNRFDPGEGDGIIFKLPSEEMEKYATKRFTEYVSDKQLRERIGDQFPVPHGVPGLEVPTIDEYIPEIFQARRADYGKAVDENWAKVQSRVIDVMGPLSKLWAILDNIRENEDLADDLDLFELLDLVEKIITLLGQANVSLLHFRKINVLYKLTHCIKKAKTLLKRHDVKEMKNFSHLFGKTFYKTLKKSAKSSKISKEISSQLGETKGKGKQHSQSKPKGGAQQQPFRGGPSPANNNGGGRKLSFKKGRGGSNRGKFLISVCCKTKPVKCQERQRYRRSEGKKGGVKLRLSRGSPYCGSGYNDTIPGGSAARCIGFGLRHASVARQSRGSSPSLPAQLEKTDLRPVCATNSTRSGDSPGGITGTEAGTSSVSSQSEGLPSSGRGNCKDAGEGGYNGGPSQAGPIYQPSVSCPQEGRNSETCDQLEKVEQLCVVSAFQDGGSSPLERLDSTQRLYGQTGLKGCLLQCPSSQQTQTPVEIQVGREAIRVSMHALRARASPENVYKDNETYCSFLETSGSTDHHLSRRYDHTQPEQVGTGEGPQLSDILAEALRVCGQLEEVLPNSDPDLGVFGLLNLHCANENGTTGGQDPQSAGQMPQTYGRETSFCQEFSRNDWPSDVVSEGCVACPSALQATTNDTGKSLSDGQILRGKSNFTSRSPQRDTLVDGQHPILEWEDYYHSLPRLSDRDRRESLRMGSCLSRSPNRGCMDGPRERSPYKRIGIERSTLCSESFHQRVDSETCPFENGQRVSGDVYTEDGGNTFQPSTVCSEGTLGLLSGERHLSVCGVSSGSPERPGRFRIQAYDRFQRLAVGKVSIPGYQPEMGPVGDRSFCQQAQFSTEQLCQLEARPLRGGSGCLPHGVERSKSLLIPSICNDPSLPVKGLQGSFHGSDSNTSVASPTVVSNVVGDGNRQSSVVAPGRKHARVSSRRSTPIDGPSGPSISGVESVRRKALAKGISVEAANLLAEHSWRKGTKCTYESAWRQWSSWCLRQQIDPLCSPVESVVNYLTDKYNEGLLYNTLNIHRSAISAFHDLVEGCKVGQHPVVTQIMSAFFNVRPPLPRYEVTWDVDTVLEYISSLGDNEHLALKLLTWKVTMLLALACAGRSSDLHALDTRYMLFQVDEKVTFSLAELTKSRRKGKPPLKVEICAFTENKSLCVLQVLQVYLNRTRIFRERLDGTTRNQLLLSFVEPHHAVVSCTIAGWLLKLMAEAGVNTELFRAHSTRGASTSKAAAMGLSCKEILSMANWKKKDTFYKHYHRDIIKRSQNKTRKFETVVLTC